MTSSQPQQTRIEQYVRAARNTRRKMAAERKTTKRQTLPWAFVIGLVLFVVGALSAGNGGGGFAAIAIVLGFVGLIAGAIQYGVSRGRRA